MLLSLSTPNSASEIMFTNIKKARKMEIWIMIKQPSWNSDYSWLSVQIKDACPSASEKWIMMVISCQYYSCRSYLSDTSSQLFRWVTSAAIGEEYGHGYVDYRSDKWDSCWFRSNYRQLHRKQSTDSTIGVCTEQAEKRVKERKITVNHVLFCFRSLPSI